MGGRCCWRPGAKGDAPPGVADLYRYTLATHELRDLTAGYGGSVEGGLVAMRDGVRGGGGAGRVSGRGRRCCGTGAMPAKVQGAAADGLRGGDECGADGVGDGGEWRAGTPPELLYAEDAGRRDDGCCGLPAMGWEGLRRGVGTQVTVAERGDGRSRGCCTCRRARRDSGKRRRWWWMCMAGRRGRYGDRHEPLYDQMLGRGWAVLLMNPRGSTGRGAAVRRGEQGRSGRGGLPRSDGGGGRGVMKTEPVDAARMGLMGYSYGGEMAGICRGPDETASEAS